MPNLTLRKHGMCPCAARLSLGVLLAFGLTVPGCFFEATCEDSATCPYDPAGRGSGETGANSGGSPSGGGGKGGSTAAGDASSGSGGESAAEPDAGMRGETGGAAGDG